MQRHDDLVYDIGLHNGDDTAHYLSKGFRVVAIEANPTMVEHARRRFSGECSSGRLTILDVGIHAAATTMTFYVSAHDHWSSFDPASAGRHGTPTRAIEVQTRPFADILAEFGTPFYVKIDIEALDTVCLQGLRDVPSRALPAYVSWEAGPRIEEPVALMTGLGYSGFKVIRQTDHCAVRTADMHPTWSRIVRRACRALRLRPAGGASFPAGSSGPFGEDTDGRWRSARRTVAQWNALAAPGAGRDGAWFDIHARL